MPAKASTAPRSWRTGAGFRREGDGRRGRRRGRGVSSGLRSRRVARGRGAPARTRRCWSGASDGSPRSPRVGRAIGRPARARPQQAVRLRPGLDHQQDAVEQGPRPAEIGGAQRSGEGRSARIRRSRSRVARSADRGQMEDGAGGRREGPLMPIGRMSRPLRASAHDGDLLVARRPRARRRGRGRPRDRVGGMIVGSAALQSTSMTWWSWRASRCARLVAKARGAFAQRRRCDPEQRRRGRGGCSWSAAATCRSARA